jgi:hypothetical protein
LGQEGDDSFSLPAPPPPRPAARKAAIEAALRKFDGIPEASADRPDDRPPSRVPWATRHRGPAVAMMTAALVAVISIPVVQIALRDDPQEVATETGDPAVAQPRAEPPADGQPLETPLPNDAVAADTPQAAGPPVRPPAMKTEDRFGRVSSEPGQKPAFESPAPVMAAPASPPFAAAAPPPPPPPPPAEPEAEAADVGRIVVTGSRVRRNSLESASPIAVVGADAAIDRHGEFLSSLQGALRANDRRAVIRLVALPLRVTFAGETRTYRSSREVERDFDRIFTPAVRQAALTLRPDTLMVRDGGRLRGNGRIWFGCGKKTCPPESAIRIREVNS